MTIYTLHSENPKARVIQSNDIEHLKQVYDAHHNWGYNCYIEDADADGIVIFGRKHVGTIDLTPTWSAMLPVMLAAYVDGTPTGKKLALEELQRMAKIADAANEK